MKKIFLFNLIFICTYSLLSQNNTKDSIQSLFEEKSKISRQDFDERIKADRQPITKVIVDTLNADSLMQYYYHNGNLYYQVTYKNGKQNGWEEQYHPNGQFEEKRFFINGYSLLYNCSFVAFDRFGDISYTSICAFYKKKKYSFQTDYVLGEPFALMIYNMAGVLVAEFKQYDGKNWQQDDYHCKSVKYANKLLSIYLKMNQ